MNKKFVYRILYRQNINDLKNKLDILIFQNFTGYIRDLKEK